MQSWGWSEFRGGSGWRVARLVAETDGVVVGVMQALVRRFRPFGALLYVPRGPAVLDAGALRPLLEHLRPLAKEQHALLARVEPDLSEGPESAALLRALGLRPAAVTVQLPHTVLVDLTPEPEAILASFKATWRRYIRHAPARGVTIREGTADDLWLFYALERETATRQGILGRPLDYYERFYAQFAGAGAHLWIAEVAGEADAAILTLEHGRTATYLYGGSSRRHADAHATYLLQWSALLHARASGCAVYDLWGTAAPGDTANHAASLNQFKGGFGQIVALTGAWDLPTSPLYPVWRIMEQRRQARVQRAAQRRSAPSGRMTTAEKEEGMAELPLTLREVTDAPAAQWDAWLAASPGGGHWMQAHAWGEFKQTHRWEPRRFLLYEGTRPAGSGQIMLYRVPLLGTLAYCPKGPWLDWSRPEHVAAFFDGVRKALRQRRAFLLKIEPEALEGDERLKAQLRELGFRKFRWDPQFKTTMVVDLSPSEDQILARMSQTARRYIRAAQREGVEVVEETSEAAMDEFYRLFEVTSKRGGFFLRPKRYVTAYWRHLIAAGAGRFLFARKGGETVVAMFHTSFGTKVYYKDGASVVEGQQAHAPYALQWAAMRWGKAHGADYYDMVAIPPPDQLENKQHEMWGLYEFKRKFGGEVRDFLGAYDQPYAKRIAFLWDRLIEPVYYRAYMRLKRDVYY